MATSLPSDTELCNRIQPSVLAENGFARPQNVMLTSGTDHSGDAALYISIIYPESTLEAAISWQKVKDMVRWVRNEIRKAGGEDRWPYVRVIRESDLITEAAR